MEFDYNISGLPQHSSLQAELHLKQELLKNVVSSIDEEERRITLLKEHLKQALQFSAFNQDLFKAQEEQMKSEVNLCKLKSEEKNWINSEILKLNRNVKDVELKLKKYQRSLLVKKRHLDDLQSALVWETDTCHTWLKEAVRCQEDNLSALEEHKESSAFIRKLFCQVQKMQAELLKCKKMKEEVFHTFYNLQVEIRRTSEDFSANHLDRENVLKLWEQSIREVEMTESDLDLLSKDLESLRMEESYHHLSILGLKESVAKEQKAQKLSLDQLEQLDAAASLLNQQISGPQGSVKSDLQSLKYQVWSLSSESVSIRRVVNKLQGYLQQKIKQKDTLCEEQSRMEASSSFSPLSQNSPHQEEVKLLESMLTKEQKHQEQLQQSRLRDQCTAREQAIKDLKTKRKQLAMQLQNDHRLNEKKDNLSIQKKNELDQKKKLLSNLETNLNYIQKRLLKLTGTKAECQTAKTQSQKLETAEGALAQKVKKNKSLEARLSQTKEDVKKAIKNLDNLKCEHKNLEDSAAILEKDSDALQDLCARLNQENKELSIDNSLLQVVVRQMQYLTEDFNLGILNTMDQKQDLQEQMAQKVQSAVESLQMLQSHVNSANAEKHKRSLQLQKKMNKLQTIKSRFEVSLFTLPAQVDDDPTSVINKALELKKSHCEQEAAIDEAISQNERDLLVLQSYVHSVDSANGSTRANCIVNTSEKEKEKALLEEQLKDHLQSLYGKRKSSQEARETLNRMEVNVRELTTLKEKGEGQLKEVRYVEEKAQFGVAEQEQKISRADKAVQRLIEEADLAQTDMEDKQKYMELSLLTRLFQNMKSAITFVVKEDPDFYMNVYSLIKTK